MELRYLKTFRIAAEYLNFTRAAQKLNFTQPTVTAQIRSLEHEIGHPLFFRIGKQTFLTPHGEIVKDYADSIFTTLDTMHARLLEMNQVSTNKLVIAASETFCTYYFPRIIREFLDDIPLVSIKLLSCYSNEVIKGVVNNDYDLGIISGSYAKSGVTNIELSKDEDLILIAAKKLIDHYDSRYITEHFPFIKYEIVGPFKEQMNAYITDAGISAGKVIECSSLEAVKSAVLNGVGIGLITRNLVRNELEDQRLVEMHVNKRAIKVKTSLIVASAKFNDAAVVKLIKIIEKNWRRINNR